MDYYDIYDLVNYVRLKAGEEDLTLEEAFDMLTQEVAKREYE
jgi:hypothetical protein